LCLISAKLPQQVRYSRSKTVHLQYPGATYEMGDMLETT